MVGRRQKKQAPTKEATTSPMSNKENASAVDVKPEPTEAAHVDTGSSPLKRRVTRSQAQATTTKKPKMIVKEESIEEKGDDVPLKEVRETKKTGRGRGRPRKRRRRKAKEEEEEETKVDVEEGSKAEDDVSLKEHSEIKKTGRGRPRKAKEEDKEPTVDVAEDSKVEDDVPLKELSEIKKSGRGRPRKVKEEPEHEEEKTEAKGAKKSTMTKTRAAGRGKDRKPANAKRGEKEEDEVEEEDPKDKDYEEESEEDDGKSTMKSTGKSVQRVVRCEGKAPVFDCCPIKESAFVYSTPADTYSIMLNKTDIGNNNNKFYGIQVLQHKNGKEWSCFLNWGRVGYKGQNSVHTFNTPDKAVDMFCSKFQAKTSLSWAERKEDPVPRKYRVVEVDNFGDDLDDGKEEDNELDDIPSELSDELLAMMKLITDTKSLARGIRSIELSYDNSEKMPLGKLTTAQLMRGYDSLKEIESILSQPKPSRSELIHASNDFFSNIPHSFGFRVPPVIDNNDEVKQKTELLNTLREVQIAVKTIDEGIHQEFCDKKIHPIDRMYQTLHCLVQPVDMKAPDYEMVSSYLKTNHASSHMYEMKLEQVFSVCKVGESDRFMTDIGNRMLLWHGSRLTNMCGIMSHGLKIAPPEAPSTGYMFGKGVYFADMSSKSGNYCFPKHKEQGFLLLAEVALGKSRELKDADYKADKLPKDNNSTFGLGKWVPDTKTHRKALDDVLVPTGKPVKVSDRDDCSLLYNEFVVYNEKQIRLRYMVQVTFLTD